ncbi:unnamed protein product [Schistosoma mattheei]|uniref:Uncharacterized protein n=1 Tax=Schistosoma mattheei TaxID=31246 RepID=A0A183P6D0_9TREM|nr:unnamed protein product [Schistosoma mattheei]
MAILQQHFFDLSNKLAALQAALYTIHIRRARSSSRKMPFPRQYSRSPKPIPGVYWYHHNKLVLYLPNPVEPDSSKAAWNEDKETLEITMKNKREYDFINE